MLNIKPLSTASQRTKNRIKEHSPFDSISKPKKVFAMDNRLCVLCKSKNWFGWLPVREIEIETL